MQPSSVERIIRRAMRHSMQDDQVPSTARHEPPAERRRRRRSARRSRSPTCRPAGARRTTRLPVKHVACCRRGSGRSRCRRVLLLVAEAQQRQRVLGVVRLVEGEDVRLAEVPEPQDAGERGDEQRADPAPPAVVGHRRDEPLAQRQPLGAAATPGRCRRGAVRPASGTARRVARCVPSPRHRRQPVTGVTLSATAASVPARMPGMDAGCWCSRGPRSATRRTRRPGWRAELAGADVVAAEDTRRLRRLASDLGVDDRRPRRVVLRGQRGGADAGAGRGAGRRAPGCCWSPTPACRRCPTPATGWSRAAVEAGIAVTAVPGPERGAHRAGRVRACPSTGSASRASCRARRASAPPGSRRSPTSRARWSSSRRRTGSRRRWPRWPRRSAPTAPAAVCRELTKTYEEVRRGGAGRAGRVGRRRAYAARSPSSSAAPRAGPAGPTSAADAELAAMVAARARPRADPQGGDRRGGRRAPGCRSGSSTTPSSRLAGAVRPPSNRRGNSLARVDIGLAHARGRCADEGVLRHHADLLRQRRPAHRARLHDGRRRRPHPLAPAARRAGLVPDRHRRARREGPAHRRGERRRRRRSGATSSSRPRGSRSSRRSTPPTTTSSAPPRSGTPRRVQEFWQGALRQAARSTRARTRARTACTARSSSSPSELARRRGRVRRPEGLRRSTAARSSCSREGNYFFQLSKYADALLELYERAPRLRRSPRQRAQRGALVRPRSGLQDLSISRSTFDWGIPVPWDADHVLYVWIDALLNYATAVGLGDTEATRRREFAQTLPGRRAPGRQGHPAVPRGDLAGDADGRRAAVAPQGVRARLAAGRRREDEQVQAHRHRAARDHRPLRLGRVPLLLPARDPVRLRRLVLLGGHERALHLRARQRLRQPRVAGRGDGRPVLRRRAARRRASPARPRPSSSRRRWRRRAEADARDRRRSTSTAASRRSGSSSTRSTATSPSRSRGRWPRTTGRSRARLETILYTAAEALRGPGRAPNPVMPKACAALWDSLGCRGGARRARRPAVGGRRPLGPAPGRARRSPRAPSLFPRLEEPTAARARA